MTYSITQWLTHPRTIMMYTLLSGAVLLSVIAGPAYADSQASFTFTNNTGAAVDDLHMEFNTAVDVTDKGAFQNIADNNTSKPTLSGGTVANGASTQIKVTGQAGKTHLKKWWWTLRGQPVGGEHKKCVAPDCTTP